ncbi:MAG: hypothetical protein GY898_16335 [Proteobacteria bacterium]|nr:hypothetical protein [Pseudomonadota bacterium]
MNRIALFAALAALSIAPAVAHAGAAGAIEADRAAGLITDHEARMQTFAVVFAPERLAPEYAALDVDDAPPCATTLVNDLKLHWDELSPEERHAVADATDPFYRAAVADGGMSWLEGDPTEERSTCYGPQNAWTQAGEYDYTEESDNFVLHYNLGGNVTEVKIDLLSGWFEDSLIVEHEEMGFYLPANMTVYQMLVIVETLGSPNTGGFTSAASCGLSGYMPYVVVNTAWFDDNERLQSVAAHEFFHGIQYEYAYEGLFMNDTPNRWFIEASAVFMETEVYPTLYQSQFSQAARWFFEPYRSIQTYDNTGFQYGAYVFLASIRESVGEADWFHELWDQIEGRTGFDLIDEIDELMVTRETTFRRVYGDFVERGATGDFEFNPYIQLEDDFISVELADEHDADDYPLFAEVNGESGLERPEYLGSNYVYLDGDDIADDQALWITFNGVGVKDGDALSWTVRLVAIKNDEPRATWSMTLEQDEFDWWFGQALLNDFGEDFDGVFIAASPTTGEFEGTANWIYTAHLVDTWGDGGFIEVPEALLNEPIPDGDGCSSGCSAAANRPSFLLLLPLLAGLRRRRVRE